MKVLYVDLEREWRGGQSQALLTLRGLRDRGHDARLLTAQDSHWQNVPRSRGFRCIKFPDLDCVCGPQVRFADCSQENDLISFMLMSRMR